MLLDQEKMPLDTKIRRRMEQLLTARDDRKIAGPRLHADARRLWQHTSRWIGQHLITPQSDAAMELACYSLQLPMKHLPSANIGKFGQLNLRERAEQAAEEMVSEIGETDETLLDATTTLLLDIPQRKPATEDAKLLADVVNLEDFGVSGLLHQQVLLASHGQGIDELLDAADKRDSYGYFEARIKDGFHFGPLRELARRRLVRMRQAVELLKQELAETHP